MLSGQIEPESGIVDETHVDGKVKTNEFNLSVFFPKEGYAKYILLLHFSWPVVIIMVQCKSNTQEIQQISPFVSAKCS